MINCNYSILPLINTDNQSISVFAFGTLLVRY